MLYGKKIVSSLYLLLGCLTMSQSQSAKTIADKIVAVVGDRIILYSDIKNAIDPNRYVENVLPDIECRTTEKAIISKVFAQQAEKDSLPVTDEDIEAVLDQKIRYYIKLFGSKKIVEEIAGKSIYQVKDEAREPVRERMLADAMQQKIVSGIKITPAEVKTFFEHILKDSLPFLESELEVGQIIIYPNASDELEQYTINELNNYKKQIENKLVTFCQLAKTIENPDDKNECVQHYINRNEKTWDQGFLSEAFRLKAGEISKPVRTKKMGYFLIQMVERNGDDAEVRLIQRIPPVTDAEINMALKKLDTVRSAIVAGKIGFNEAAVKYSDNDPQFSSPFFLNSDGVPSLTINQLDKDVVSSISKIKIGDFSQPVAFTNEQGKKGARIVYLKSRSEPHRMNLRDDYSKISQMALEEKKGLALDKWLKTKIPTYYIMVDNITAVDCPKVQKYASGDTKGF